MLRLLRYMPLWRVLAIAKIVLLARRHFRRVDAADRRRMSERVLAGAAPALAGGPVIYLPPRR